MDPVINQLLSGYSPEIVNAYRKTIPTNVSEKEMVSETKEDQLRQLKRLLSEELITSGRMWARKAKSSF